MWAEGHENRLTILRNSTNTASSSNLPHIFTKYILETSQLEQIELIKAKNVSMN